MMRVSEATVSALSDRGIAVEVLPTPQAVRRYSLLVTGGTEVAACLHLTC